MDADLLIINKSIECKVYINDYKSILFVGFRPTRDFFTHMETSLLPGKDANFDLCSGLMVIEL